MRPGKWLREREYTVNLIRERIKERGPTSFTAVTEADDLENEEFNDDPSMIAAMAGAATAAAGAMAYEQFA